MLFHFHIDDNISTYIYIFFFLFNQSICDSAKVHVASDVDAALGVEGASDVDAIVGGACGAAWFRAKGFCTKFRRRGGF